MATKHRLLNADQARCESCGAPCQPKFDDGQQFFEGPSGRQVRYQVTDPEWLSDCCWLPVVTPQGDAWNPEFEEDGY